MGENYKVKNYDPNIRFATQEVAITFQAWDYKTTKVAHIGGNCKGLVSADNNVWSVLHLKLVELPFFKLKMDRFSEITIFKEPKKYNKDWSQ